MAYKSVKRVGRAVVGGFREYRQQMREINEQAELNVGNSGSREFDVQQQAKEMRRLKRERGVSFISSVRRRL